MRGQSVVLRACMPVARGEDLPAEALAEAPRPGGLEVGERDSTVGGEAQLRGLLLLEEDPGGPESEALQDGVEGGVQDGLHVLLAVKALRDLGEYGELALAVLDGPLQGAQA